MPDFIARRFSPATQDLNLLGVAATNAGRVSDRAIGRKDLSRTIGPAKEAPANKIPTETTKNRNICALPERESTFRNTIIVSILEAIEQLSAAVRHSSLTGAAFDLFLNFGFFGFIPRGLTTFSSALSATTFAVSTATATTFGGCLTVDFQQL